MSTRKFKLLVALLGSVAIISCQSTPVYRAYVLDASDYTGVLRAPRAQDDVTLEMCRPDEASRGKCVVYFQDEFFLFKQAYLELSQRLSQCQGGQSPVSFSYRYYGIDAKSYAGSLRGPKPKDDKNFLLCTPTESNKAPCIALSLLDYTRLKGDYKTMIIDLNECESNRH